MFKLFSFVFLLSTFLPAQGANEIQRDFEGSPEELVKLCSGRIENDYLAQLCEGFPQQDPEFTQIGAQRTEDRYEKLLNSISLEVEMSYDLFILANTRDPKINKDADQIVPAQNMLIIEKKYKSLPIFLRDPKTGLITGLNSFNVKVVDEIFEDKTSKLWAAKRDYTRSFKDYIVDREDQTPYSGLQYFNITSGADLGGSYLPTASGVFPINIKRSKHRNTKSRSLSPEAPMSNALYFGYLYGDRPGPVTELNNDYFLYSPSSGMAIHGTPSAYWDKLGNQRGSHGCVRSHPVVAEALYNYVMNMEDKEVPLLQWDLPEAATYELEDSSLLLHSTKPALIISFNGYESISI